MKRPFLLSDPVCLVLLVIGVALLALTAVVVRPWIFAVPFMCVQVAVVATEIYLLSDRSR